MGDCNFALSYPETKEKYCKFSYASWCATCERNSPRRRSRSESLEPCRRKCKEMKTLTPKKFNKSTEYENMELEYDYKGWHETKYDCCRIRSNLVELPTSYISNNCQSLSRNDGESLKNVKPYEHTLKFVDFNSQMQNFDSMQENAKFSPSKIDSVKSHYRPATFFKAKSPGEFENQIKNHQDVQNANFKCELSRYSNCREFCTLADFKHHSNSEKRPLCYDTGTYFTKQIDSVNLHEKYNQEVEYLRERLRILKNTAFNGVQSTTIVDKDEIKANGDSLKNSFVTSSIDVKPKVVKRERRIISPPLVKSARSKISVKTKRTNPAKMKKPKSKVVAVSSDASQSDYSGSESDTVDDSGDEDPESLNDQSTDESNKDSSDTTISVGPQDTGSGDTTVGWPIRPSLFPNIPPYIKFNSHDLEVAYKVPNGRKYFKWKLSTITPVIVRKTLTNSGFVLVRKSNTWLGTWGKHMKSPMFKTLKESQKLNHFPGTFQLGRKDRLWRNFQRMISKFGIREFGFLPHTYVLPQEIRLLKQNWEFRNGTCKETWIIKPPASARGVGIKVINKWSQLPKKTSIVVQKYISNPYLINGSKFDLRLYVLVTSFHPLRIYLYPDGLARFASAKYSDDDKDLKDRYMHLTNYSINKLSSQYTANEDANACQGHKWTISKLMEFLRGRGVDTNALWKSLQQLVIKTIITAEPHITPLCEENMNSTYNCYELFGVDVLLDDHLKPWLLEVNISPSLHSASPLDAHVKGPLVRTLFDMAQFHFPRRPGHGPPCLDPRVYTTALTKREVHKHKSFEQFERRQDYLSDILGELTGDDVRHLARGEDELTARGRFERIFPTAHTHKYLEFMEPRYYNRLFDAWEARYAGRRGEGIAHLQLLCIQKVHLKVAPQSTFSKNLLNTTPMAPEMKLVPSVEGQSRPLEDIMQEASITNKISTTND